MKKLTIFFLIFSFSFLSLSLFLYLDYKKNPITYIILSKKFEIVSYLFFTDLPAIYPTYNSYHISYERQSDDDEKKDFFSKGEGIVTIKMPRDTYKTGIPQKLRKVLDHYAELDPNKEEDRKIIENIMGTYDDPKGRVGYMIFITRDVLLDGGDLHKRIKEYISELFPKKFVVEYISQHKEDEKCGKNSYDVGVVFDKNPARMFEIALTNSGKICFIWDEPTKVSDYEFRILKENYKDYWL